MILRRASVLILLTVATAFLRTSGVMRFSVAPELTLNAGYWVTPHVRLFAGYNFLLWTNVIRPGDQIDRVVDLTFVPNSPAAPFSGQMRPRPLFAQRDLVINGIQFGLDWRW